MRYTLYSMDKNTVLSVIIGSVLGFLATLFSARITSKRQISDQESSYTHYLRLELDPALKSLEDIRTSFEQKNHFDYLLLELLDNYVNNLQEARKQAYLIRNEKLQNELFSVINRISLLSKDMRGIQNYEYADNETVDSETGKKRQMNQEELKSKIDLIRDKRQSKLMEILDLKREVRDVVNKLNES